MRNPLLRRSLLAIAVAVALASPATPTDVLQVAAATAGANGAVLIKITNDPLDAFRRSNTSPVKDHRDEISEKFPQPHLTLLWSPSHESGCLTSLVA